MNHQNQIRHRIRRADLQAIINHCIKVSRGELQFTQRLALREVPVRSRRVAFNCWETDGVGCPVTQALGYNAHLTTAARHFGEHFDAAIHDWLIVDQGFPPRQAFNEGVLEVTD